MIYTRSILTSTEVPKKETMSWLNFTEIYIKSTTGISYSVPFLFSLLYFSDLLFNILNFYLSYEENIPDFVLFISEIDEDKNNERFTHWGF